MPRLIDDIRLRGVQMPAFVSSGKEREWVDYARTVLKILSDPTLPVLLVDNVADYYYRGTDQEFWSFDRDFPNLAPPFEQFWCEHKMPRVLESKERGRTEVSRLIGQNGRQGVLVTALDPAAQAVAGGGTIPPECKWLLWMDLFIDYDFGHHQRPDGPHGAIFALIDAEGRMLEAPWMQSYAELADKALMKSLMTWLHPTLLSVCFLHCKNVKVEDQEVPKPLAKKYHQKTGQWPTKYRTLVIEPLKQILRHEGGSDRHGLARAMHICRGHFADYTEGRGLFGKYHGKYWIPATVRGTKGKAAPREIEVKI